MPYKLLLCFLLAGVAYPQTVKQAPAKTPPPGIIHAINIEGARIYSVSAIKNVLGLSIGGPASNDIFRAAQARLLQTDLFSNIEYNFRFSYSKPPQYDVTFKISEYDQLFPLTFEDLGVPADALRAYLRQHVTLYNDQILATNPVLQRYTEAAQAFIAQSKPELKVKAFVDSDDPAHPKVVIRPDRPLPRISGVVITGNKAIETPVLMRAINEVAYGQRLSDESLKLLLNKTVKPLYAAKGYVAVTFPKIQIEKSTEDEGYMVHLTIQEGPVFTFGSSAFRGGSFTPDDIRAMMHYKKGDVFDVSKAEQLRAAIAKSLRHDGHLNAQVTFQQEEDDKHNMVNLAYSIVPGPVYTFQTLEIHGLDIEGEPAIRKLWAPKPGKPFDPDYPEYFLKRVREMGLFDNLGSTRSTYTPDESTHTVLVSLFFGGKEGEKQKERERTGGASGRFSPH
ncbi:MAG TPA: POTRA domain-containing protein [Bryobacteraceae bacterium]